MRNKESGFVRRFLTFSFLFFSKKKMTCIFSVIPINSEFDSCYYSPGRFNGPIFWDNPESLIRIFSLLNRVSSCFALITHQAAVFL